MGKKLETGERSKEDTRVELNDFELDRTEERIRKFFNIFFILIVILLTVIFIYIKKEWVIKNLREKREEFRVFVVSNFNEEKIERSPMKAEDIEYSEGSNKVDNSLLLEKTYKSLGIIYMDKNKILERREVDKREYIYDLKKDRQYTGEFIEDIGEDKKKISKYINGFLSEYSIYLKNDLKLIKKFYKSGNERIEIVYENNEIVQIKESYDINTCKLITTYKNGKKDGEEIIYNLDGSIDKKTIRKEFL